MNHRWGRFPEAVPMLGIYVHLPFCSTHCTYCPFAISTDLALQDRYTDALLREVEDRHSCLSVDSIYLGGGTPSRTSIGNLTRLFARIRERFEVPADAEISMEANPEDVTPAALEAWRALGVNRISIGVQSFHDEELVAISRIHDRARAIGA